MPEPIQPGITAQPCLGESLGESFIWLSHRKERLPRGEIPFWQRLQHPRRIAASHDIGRQIFSDHCARAHDGIVANGHAF